MTLSPINFENCIRNAQEDSLLYQIRENLRNKFKPYPKYAGQDKELAVKTFSEFLYYRLSGSVGSAELTPHFIEPYLSHHIHESAYFISKKRKEDNPENKIKDWNLALEAVINESCALYMIKKSSKPIQLI